MSSKFNLLIIVILLQLLCIVLCQNEVLHCDFTCRGSTVCSANLTIQNPNGLNSFTEITGPARQNDIFDEVFAVPGSHSTNIPQIICETFKNIYRIGLTQIGLERVDDYAFKSCKGLMYIFLWGNRVSYIHENAFTENPKLYYLALQSNNIKVLPENLFLNQQKLEWLIVQSNPLIDIPKYVFRPLTALTQLDLKWNQILDVKSEWFETLGMLKSLDLAANLIETLPKNVFSPLRSITYIGLGSNNLTVIHADSFGILISAPKINFYGSKINAIAVQFIFNTGASMIDMQYNKCAKVSISDNSTSKELMLAGFKDCFDNYVAMTETTTLLTTTIIPSTTTSKSSTFAPPTTTLPPGCTDDDLIARICYIEDSIDICEANFNIIENVIANLTINQGKIKENLNDQHSRITENQNEINSLKSAVLELQKNLSNQLTINDELESQIKDLQSATKTLALENQEILKEKEIIEEKVENLNNIVKTELQNLEDKILVLSTRPCSC